MNTCALKLSAAASVADPERRSTGLVLLLSLAPFRFWYQRIELGVVMFISKSVKGDSRALQSGLQDQLDGERFEHNGAGRTANKLFDFSFVRSSYRQPTQARRQRGETDAAPSLRRQWSE
jgi:hypothetical protein